MKCPNCKETDLLMTERQSIEIDYCPSCRGIWLDRGELDRLIEKAQAEVATPPSRPVTANTQQYPQESYYKKQDDDYYKHQKHYKRKSLLGEIFDF